MSAVGLWPSFDDNDFDAPSLAYLTRAIIHTKRENGSVKMESVIMSEQHTAV